MRRKQKPVRRPHIAAVPSAPLPPLPAGALAALRREALGAWGFTARQFALIRRFWRWEAVFLAYAVVNAVAIGYIVPGMALLEGSDPAAERVRQLTLYLLVGSILWGFLSTLFDEIASVMAWECWEGTIEFTFMAPVSRAAHLAGISLFAALYGALRTVVVLALVALLFDLPLDRANLGGALLVLAAGSVSFTGLGVLAAVLPLVSTEKGSQVAKIAQALLLMVSGIYYPVAVLPGWMQAVATLSPATYCLNGVRRAILDGVPTSALAGELAALGAIALVALPLGFAAFAAGERYARRRGLLKRNG